MLQNAYFLAKIGADTAENEQHFAEICQKLATTRSSSVAARSRGGPGLRVIQADIDVYLRHRGRRGGRDSRVGWRSVGCPNFEKSILDYII